MIAADVPIGEFQEREREREGETCLLVLFFSERAVRREHTLVLSSSQIEILSFIE